MKEIKTEIIIHASAQSVWNILTDLGQFREWNPFILRAEGEVQEGARLTVYIQPPGGRGMTFKPTVTRAAAPRELRWLGHLLVPGLFDGEHIFELLPIDDDSIRFVQRERFRGLLVPVLWRNLDTRTRQGFNDMNAAIKKRAEEA